MDEFRRYERLRVDVALSGVQGAVRDYTIPDAWMTGRGTAPLTPLQAPRVVGRRDLEDPTDEVSRLATYLRRALTS